MEFPRTHNVNVSSGQINHKDFAKDPRFDLSETNALYWQVEPYFASNEEYDAAYPEVTSAKSGTGLKEEIVEEATVTNELRMRQILFVSKIN